MQKFNVRYGCILLCGKLPPAGGKVCGAIVVNAAFTVGNSDTIYATEKVRGRPMPTNDWWSSVAWVPFWPRA